ncbi:alpha/beta hydrolase [Nocardia neocaledoniensis]|uniref:alpha/beta hydrolase n=1 Tax=Nocardia neocaledoniensis TaxID=236511 RepID=UPI002454D3DB|nr:alpha/beta hydrolase [Nocardia neocaledoniensis]
MPHTAEHVDFPSAGDVTIAGYRWDPQGEPRAIAQIVHGVGEYALRYTPLAEALTARGFVVYAHDHRGHGRTLIDGQVPGTLGVDGWPELVADIGRMAELAHRAYPTLPLVLIAHSLGSFATQQVLPDRSFDFDAVALSGTTAVDLLEPAIDLNVPLDLAAFNAPFEPARTEFDWISRDEAQVDAYITDPLCGFGLDIASGKALFAGARQAADAARVSSIRSDLPIYITVGDQDPVNGQLALVNALVDRYREAGLSDVTLEVWKDARHEVFNETNRDEVFAHMFEWIDRALT